MRSSARGKRTDEHARILLILPGDVVDRARALAGRATSAFKLPVSLQIVLRALIEQGLRPEAQGRLRASIERQARAMRQKRRITRQAGGSELRRGPSGGQRRDRRREEGSMSRGRRATT